MKSSHSLPAFVLSIIFFGTTIVLLFIDTHSNSMWQLYGTFGATIISLLLFIGFLGKKIRGQWTGILIDARFKYSLSRVQALAWFIILGSAIYAITLHNLAWNSQPCQFSVGDSMVVDVYARNIQQLITADGQRVFLHKVDGCEYQGKNISSDNRESENKSTTYDVLSVKKSTMEIDIKLLGLMGLGLGTGLISPLLRRRANAEGATEQVEFSSVNEKEDGTLPSGKAAIGNIIVNKKSEGAEFIDIFVGEKLDDAEQIDMYKVQMAFFSIIVYTIYLLLLNETFQTQNGFFISALPAIEGELLTLLLISHGGYLSGKVIGTSIGKPAAKVVQPASPPDRDQQEIVRKKEKLRYQRDTISAVANAARKRNQKI